MESSTQRTQFLFVAVAIFVVVDTLLVVPVLVVAFQRPGLLWAALGPYLMFTFGVLGWFGYLAYRWQLLDFQVLFSDGLVRFLGVLGLLTVALIGVEIASPGFVWVVPYTAGVAYATYRLLKWQVRNLAFQCQECQATFSADFRTWLLSPNMGTRKSVACPECGKRTWARVVRST